MATRRPLAEAELGLMEMFIGKAKVTEVKEAIGKGAKVELEQSVFSDAGPDYCAVLVDGKRVAKIDGY